jgi:hypothetical protein
LTGDPKADVFVFLKQLLQTLLGFFAREFKSDSTVALELFEAIARFLEHAKP